MVNQLITLPSVNRGSKNGFFGASDIVSVLGLAKVKKEGNGAVKMIHILSSHVFIKMRLGFVLVVWDTVAAEEVQIFFFSIGQEIVFGVDVIRTKGGCLEKEIAGGLRWQGISRRRRHRTDRTNRANGNRWLEGGFRTVVIAVEKISEREALTR